MTSTNNIRIRNAAETCYIDIEGTIGVPESWQFDNPDERVATYEGFRAAVERIGAIRAADVVVSIRSTGGDVNDALLIYEALRRLDARVTTRCYGYTASAATLIAQAASEGRRQISDSALYLIHHSICAAEGNAEELAARTDLLRRTDERLAGVYAARSGRPAESFAALMAENNGNGRWLSPEECIEAGLADTLIDPAAETPSGPKNLAQRWRRFVARIGGRSAEPLPTAAPDVLRFAGEAHPGAERPSPLSLAERQRQAAPTRTAETEDPPFGDPIRSANRRAYDEDARLLRGGRN